MSKDDCNIEMIKKSVEKIIGCLANPTTKISVARSAMGYDVEITNCGNVLSFSYLGKPLFGMNETQRQDHIEEVFKLMIWYKLMRRHND